jgi:hypothetical protein
VKRDQSIVNPGKPSVAGAEDDSRNEFGKVVSYFIKLPDRMILISELQEINTFRSKREKCFIV